MSDEIEGIIKSELENRLREKERKFSRDRMLIILIISLISFGLFFVLYSELFVDFYPRYSDFRENDNLLKIGGSFLIFMAFVIFSYLYMEGFSLRRPSAVIDSSDGMKENEKAYLEMISILRSMEKSIEKGKLESALSNSEREEIIKNISSTVESQLNDSLLLKIESTYGRYILNDKLSSKSNDLLSKTVKRLNEEVQKLQSKASVNLTWGIGTTVIAVGILMSLLIFGSPPDTPDIIDKSFYYTSRIFLVFLVQGIAIFFLKLYKKTLDDIMYTNNEITNYEAKRDAISLCFMSGELKSSKEILELLAKTERNFILKKGESSIFSYSDNSEDKTLGVKAVKGLQTK